VKPYCRWPCAPIVCLLGASLLCASAAFPAASSQLASAERKLEYIDRNGDRAHPKQNPTILTEGEVNAYLASGEVDLPEGVDSVKLRGEDGTVTGTAHVDFDRVREGVHSSNPLLGIFSGVHDVVVVTHAHGADGEGYVHVDSVSLDGIEVPRFILQIFVEKFLQPKHPELGLDSRFALPDRIDTATVGQHILTVTQK
jgi:hypothetical protein